MFSASSGFKDKQNRFGNTTGKIQGSSWGMNSTLFNKDNILFKTSNLNGTAVRVWNNLVFNPSQTTNSENNVNPLLPKFFHNPSMKEM